MKTQTLQNFFQTILLFARILPQARQKFRQYRTIFGGVRAQKAPRKCHFMDAESVR